MIIDFQFLDDFKKLSVKCPPDNYKPKNMVVFRWVFEDIMNSKNFTPRYFLAPTSEWKKLNSITEEEVRDSKKCDMLALSFFDSEDGARKKLLFLLDIGLKVYDWFGTHLAMCNIAETDGVNDEPENDNYGHFNHHPKENHQYETRFKIISKL
jgi:hypothetical protein